MRPRVTFLVSGLVVGGAERHTVDLRARLKEFGLETNLMVYGPNSSKAVAAHEGAKNAATLNLKGLPGLAGWRSIRRTLRRQDPDVIVAVNQTMLIIAVAARLLGFTRAKIACVFHSAVLPGNEERQLPFFRLALTMADALIYISRNQKAYWRGRGLWCRRTPVILNGVDLTRFGSGGDRPEAVRDRLGLADTDVVFGLVAAFRPEKNHAQLVDAVAQLRAAGVPAKALFVGDGPTRPSVEERARAQGIEEHVLFTGEQADVRPFIRASDAGVLCSPQSETFSLAALEFLASGVPMVMSDVGGASEIVQHGINGYLFQGGSTPELVECLGHFAEAPVRARLSAGARLSAERYGVEGMVAQYAGFIADLAPALRPPAATLRRDREKLDDVRSAVRVPSRR